MLNTDHATCPGQKAHVSPEGIIWSTDGKLRWVCRLNKWADTSKLTAKLKKYFCVGVLLGIVPALSDFGDGLSAGLSAVLRFVPAFAVCGALLVLLRHGMECLSDGGSCCVLVTMDETMIRRQQVKGKADRDAVAHTVAVWAGGQSQPSLRFEEPIESRFDSIKTIVPDRGRNLLRIKSGARVNRICVESEQFDFVLDWLKKHCPQAEIK
ncbi:MAG: hypothetical protein J6A62_00190 [Oscillospiraceae bacterium]|nr:hypothetical protein [Oscillospiraceae bacterium]